MHLLQNCIQLLAETEPLFPGRWTTSPQVPYWVLGAGLVVATLSAVLLYRAQIRIASSKAVAALTIIRAVLILMVFLVLLGLARVFTWVGQANGTLWVMVDQSASMDRADNQATPIERLRWADVIGLLPAEARPATLDRQAARLGVLAADLSFFQSATNQSVEEKDARKKVTDIVRNLKKWNSVLTGVADTVDKESGGKIDAAVSKNLRSTADIIARGIEKIDTRQKPEDAATDLEWAKLRLTLLQSADALNAAADKSDQAILDRADAKITEAIDKIAKMTRSQLAQAVLTEKNKRGGGFDELLPKQNLKVLGFGEQTTVLTPESADQSKKALQSAFGKPTAPVTDIASGMQIIQDQVSQDEPATVILVSDGRQNRKDTETAEAVRRLASRGVRVYSVAMGTEKIAPDAAVENVDAPDWVFKGDTVKITSLLRLDGLNGRTITTELHRVQMINGVSKDTLVESKDLKVTKDRDVVSFTEKKDALPDPGLYDYRVVIKDVPDEAVTANNSQTVRIAVKDDKLTVLMLEDQPRWEYRYIANYLSRDSRIKLQTMLLQPARIGYDPDPSKNIAPPPPRKASTDEADTRQDFQILPETQEEWYRWKFIVLGDFPPERLSKKQQEMIVKAVRTNGTTLLFLSGPLNMPAAWGTSRQENPLAELFPCEPSQEWTPGQLAAHLKVGYHPAVAPDGENHLLTQFGLDETQNHQIWQTIQTDPNLAWYWHSEYTQAKGGASVLWSIADNDPASTRKPQTQPTDDKGPTALEFAQKRALLATMNAGSGKVMYLAGDASWRLRQVNGVNYHERFWGQVIRWVVSGDPPAGGRYVRFGTDKPRYVGGEPAQVVARIVDKKLEPLKGLKVRVIAKVLSPTGQVAPGSKAQVEAEMSEIPDSPGQYRATLGNLPNGQVELTFHGAEVEQLLADDPKALQKSITVEVVTSLNLEQKNVNADFRTLSGIATAGGGAMVNGAYADVLAEQIPELNYVTSSAEQIGLFNDPKERYSRQTHWIFMAIFVGLLTTEWIIRKRVGLV